MIREEKASIEGRITGIDRDKNVISLRVWDKQTMAYKETEIDLLKRGNKLETFDIVGKKFGIGDSVMFTKNDSKVKVSNGEVGTIKDIDEKGNATVTISEKKEVTFNLNNKGDRGYTYLDHAYCITDHKSQGATFDSVIVANDVSKSRSNFNAFYVEATRMRQAVTIFTNSKSVLKEQVQIEQDKLSTLGTYDFSKHQASSIRDHIPAVFIETKGKKDSVEEEMKRLKNVASRTKESLQKQEQPQQQTIVKDQKGREIGDGRDKKKEKGLDI